MPSTSAVRRPILSRPPLAARAPFSPHPLVRGGHAQTLAGLYLPGLRFPYSAHQHTLTLADGDRVVLHEDPPRSGSERPLAALLLHGLSGCHQSGYMQRLAAKLTARGVRVFRLDLRGCGAGAGLARLPYHAGRHEDVAEALRWIAAQHPDLSQTLVGFSLGGAIALNLLGRCGDTPPGRLSRAVLISPPIDLRHACRALQQGANRVYDRHFVRHLLGRVAGDALKHDSPPKVLERPWPSSVWEFDDRFTAPVCGFGRASDYYAQCSPIGVLSRIQLPTRVFTALDDPLVPPEPWDWADPSEAVEMTATRGGGHLGFLGRGKSDPDRRWIDWRIVEWVLADPAAR